MELKRRSGDGRDLFGGRSAAQIVEAYQELGAPCLSVVTGRWFGGDDRLLADVAQRADRPILVKDFFATERQIAAAGDSGAAAVLLTAELLPATSLTRLAHACLRHGLTPFVEVTSGAQLERLESVAAACVVAVSNKDIRRRERGEPEIERSLALLPAVRRAGAGCAVSASGIADPGVAARLLDAGFDGLLVGAGLLTAPDPGQWVGALARGRAMRVTG